MPNTCFPFENMKRKYSNERKNLDQIENFSYEIVPFQGTVPVSITWPMACKTDCFVFHGTHKASYLTKDSAPFDFEMYQTLSVLLLPSEYPVPLDCYQRNVWMF